MSNTKTYTFTREQLRQAFREAVIRRSDEIIRENQGCGNAWIGRVSSWDEFAEDAVKRLIDSVHPQDGSKAGKRSIKDILNDMHERGGDFANFAEELFDAVNREFAEYSNELKSEFSSLLRNNVKEAEEAEDEKEPKFEDEDEDEEDDEQDKPKGYVSSRPVDKLQFNIDTVKLANLPGLFNTLKSEGVFFKQIANRWNAGEVDECGLDRLGDGDGTVSENLADLHYCTDNFWVNPKYANEKVSSLGGIGSRVIAEDGKTSVCLWVYYLEEDGTVIAWDMDVD